MSIEEDNKRTIQRFNAEVINAGHMEVADEILDPELRHVRGALAPAMSILRGKGSAQSSGASETVTSVERFKRTALALHEGFPDWNSIIDEQVAVGDTVITRYTVQGTHTRDFLGIPPTGKRIDIAEVVFFRFVNGRIREIWAIGDELGWLRQLGVTELPPSSL
jgi:predicted ester cyclase